jgi:hypothetical protein
MARGKNKSFPAVSTSGHKERWNEDVYGRCILYPVMKIEE